MEIEIDKDIFSYALYQTQSIVEKKDIIPILTHVLIEAMAKEIKIIATNMETSYIGNYPCKTIDQGSITINAKKLYEIIKEIPPGEVFLKKKENNWLNIKHGHISFKLVGLSADEFPKVESFEKRKFFSVKTKMLKEMIEKTRFAVSDDQNKYNLNGIYLEKPDKEKNSIRMTATDGHRLSSIERLTGDEVFLEKGFIIPKKGFQEVKKITEEEEEEKIFLSFEENTGIIKKRNGVLIMHLIDAEFPDYKKFLPEEQRNSLVIERKEFINSISRISTMASQENHSTRISFEENKINIYSRSPEFGEGREEKEVEYKGDHTDIGFNAVYLIEALNVIKSDHVNISFSDSEGPVLIKDPSDIDFFSIIMPLKL